MTIIAHALAYSRLARRQRAIAHAITVDALITIPDVIAETVQAEVSQRLIWRQEYSAEARYRPGDLVRRHGAVWICLAADPTLGPPSAGWDLFAAAGQTIVNTGGGSDPGVTADLAALTARIEVLEAAAPEIATATLDFGAGGSFAEATVAAAWVTATTRLSVTITSASAVTVAELALLAPTVIAGDIVAGQSFGVYMTTPSTLTGTVTVTIVGAA